MSDKPVDKEARQYSLIYKFLFDHFEEYMQSESDATDKMYKILEIIKQE